MWPSPTRPFAATCHREPRAAGAARAQQLVRLRRQQLQPDPGAGRDGSAVGAVAVLGPGLDGWEQSQGILRGSAPYLDTELRAAGAAVPAADRATANRPRSGWRWRAAEARCEAPGSLDVSRLASVFASANGDGAVIDAILEHARQSRPHAVSPTQFHNSVHNGPPAYWSIGCAQQRRLDQPRLLGRHVRRGAAAGRGEGEQPAGARAVVRLRYAVAATARGRPRHDAAIRHRHGADAAAGAILRGRDRGPFRSRASPRASVVAEPCDPAPALPNEPGGPCAAAA